MLEAHGGECSYKPQNKAAAFHAGFRGSLALLPP